MFKCSNTDDHELLKSLPLKERYLGNVLNRLQNSRFFLKISKEIGKAGRKSYAREASEPHMPLGRVRREYF